MGVHDGHRKRLKTQFLIHGEDFHDHQLLELLLCYAIPQGDVNGLAHALLDQFGSLAGVFDALPPSLTRVDGVGEHTAVLLKLIPKLAGRYSTIRSSPGDILASSRAARDYLLPYFQTGPRNEMVYLVCMDAKYKVLGCHKLGEGTVNAADITPRRVVELALAHNASAVLLAHNHVSGLALPSNADLLTTETLARVLREVGVELADHLIFTEDDMVSLKDSGLLNGYPNPY
ncbi:MULTISPECIES: JAB domain-containing protein [Intestinimonas]|uniref:DNA repair protein RadC n=1 Tax=Intestinimonas massiliensis (ex Afouda et al. 2020) TaxID=1673721 RepID=A0ABS9M4R5_9FIRM|nr:JAB domain-containing protein [Intestinimonas massiliensis (ex Afouda et al. 2020)]MBS6281522.1 DNA repair protein RadC [Oscillospiraceae bacterium]MDU1323881.1 JAB domain-containing protein [Clostridiales bacterium]CUQ20729.1 DNA repair protein radc [Flavonifractor plautii]SCJ08011.1 DNA repair protein RadC [uncultured Flavonifractor sp.]MCG4525780.1 DNA repair protein RadC [Intestinimonas massiliensis (ex Afouda et al. 2020)]